MARFCRHSHESLAVALASGQTLRAAAASVGIGERTAARRLADTAFVVACRNCGATWSAGH